VAKRKSKKTSLRAQRSVGARRVTTRRTSKRVNLKTARASYSMLVLSNPNYFGSVSASDVASVPKAAFKLLGNTSYEQVTCVGYNPQTEELRAVVKVKKTGGYSGGPCTDGSKEYVRFYVDYERNGTWVDEGVASFDAHDLPFKRDLCYGVVRRIDPTKHACCHRDPVLPRVRAILSWNVEPPPAQPNWSPTWGNRLEANIQIAPSKSFWCKVAKLFPDTLVKEIDPSILNPIPIDPPIGPFPPDPEPLPGPFPPGPQPDPVPFEALATPLPMLKAAYKNKVEDARVAYNVVHALKSEPTSIKAIDNVAMLVSLKIDVAKIADFIAKAKFKTTYEELVCVGLNRDLSVLHADLVVKKPSGYSGDLCTKGSREYVAFYMDFGAGWQYMGTNSVQVHDISQMPSGGLWYNVPLPVSLTAHQKQWCQTGQAKVRAILSWNVMPPANQPNYVAPWGDWAECHVEIKPFAQGQPIPGTTVLPFIESLGGMPVTQINSSGYANGQNSDGMKANDSPFDGVITLNGIIFNAPDSSNPAIDRLKFRTMVKQPGASVYQESLQPFRIDVTTYNGSSTVGPVPTTQTPDSNGWVEYYPDMQATTSDPTLVSVDRNKLSQYVPSIAGLHRVYIQVQDSGGNNYYSSVIRFMVDKSTPSVAIDITSGSGNCGVFAPGDTLSGTFSIADGDNHCGSVSLSVSPGGSNPPANGAAPEIIGYGKASLSYGIDLPTSGISGAWELDTTVMDPCGYNIRVHGVDRTIVHSRWVGRHVWGVRGFCLLFDES
jgi:hypothetical protein